MSPSAPPDLRLARSCGISARQNAAVPLVLVPGFTQTAASWSAVARVVERSIAVRALDLPEPADFGATARAIGDAGGPGVYAGYSMGGRLGLRLALDRPDVVRALVLVSATPGIEDASERAARVASDERWAAFAERDGVDAFLTEWLAQPMFASVPDDAPGLADRASLTPAFLAACLRRLGTGAMEPMWERLPELTIPVLLVTGTRDPKFTAIARRMLERLPDAEHRNIDAGHALPLEQPGALGGAIADFARRAH
jgi:2-succinyl-6-hydroxy-2,4-cyclohexadiene-1-carboxylate synthase